MANAITRACLAAMAAVIVAGYSPPPMRADQGAFEVHARPWSNVEQAERDKACRDSIQQVRDTNRHPQVRRETASPDKPLQMAAVDLRVNGCSVMVMSHDTSDIRPLPKIEQRLEIIPAR